MKFSSTEASPLRLSLYKCCLVQHSPPPKSYTGLAVLPGMTRSERYIQFNNIPYLKHQVCPGKNQCEKLKFLLNCTLTVPFNRLICLSMSNCLVICMFFCVICKITKLRFFCKINIYLNGHLSFALFHHWLHLKNISGNERGTNQHLKMLM